MSEVTEIQFSETSTEEIRGRRSFMQRAALLSGLALATGYTPLFAGDKQKKPDGKSDIGILNTALGLEHEGIAAYQIAAESGLLQPQVLAVGVLFQSHHKAHRDELAKLVRMAGGTPVEPKSLADYAKDINAAAIKSQEDILKLAVRLERGATSAYIGSIASLHDFKLAQRFASLGADEAIHWNTLSSAIGEPPPKGAFISDESVAVFQRCTGFNFEGKNEDLWDQNINACRRVVVRPDGFGALFCSLRGSREFPGNNSVFHAKSPTGFGF